MEVMFTFMMANPKIVFAVIVILGLILLVLYTTGSVKKDNAEVVEVKDDVEDGDDDEDENN